jgi:hypothetical protein
MYIHLSHSIFHFFIKKINPDNAVGVYVYLDNNSYVITIPQRSLYATTKNCLLFSLQSKFTLFKLSIPKKLPKTLEKISFLSIVSHYSTPFVLGKASLYGFRFTAILIALANALKMASILWCSFSP